MNHSLSVLPDAVIAAKIMRLRADVESSLSLSAFFICIKIMQINRNAYLLITSPRIPHFLRAFCFMRLPWRALLRVQTRGVVPAQTQRGSR